MAQRGAVGEHGRGPGLLEEGVHDGAVAEGVQLGGVHWAAGVEAEMKKNIYM